jgi:hypothetical protein
MLVCDIWMDKQKSNNIWEEIYMLYGGSKN